MFEARLGQASVIKKILEAIKVSDSKRESERARL
jgi:hypothetical protein